MAARGQDVAAADALGQEAENKASAGLLADAIQMYLQALAKLPSPAEFSPGAIAVDPVQPSTGSADAGPPSVSSLVGRGALVGARAKSQPPPPGPPPEAPAQPLSSRSAADADTRAIEAVLHEYERAFSTLDYRAVQSVYPSVDVSQLREQFDGLKNQTAQVQQAAISLDASGTATVLCTWSVDSEPKIRARRNTTSVRQRITLKKQSGRWIIVGIASGE